MKKAMFYKASKDFLDNYNLSKDYDSFYELSYIMYKGYEDNILTIEACAENKKNECIYFDPMLFTDIKESYLIVDNIFEKMENGYELLYMSCDLHFDCWRVINDDYPNLCFEIGVSKYLDYCKQNSITKDVLNALNQSTITDCAEPIRIRNIQGKTQLNKNTSIINEHRVDNITYLLLEDIINGELLYSYGLKRDKIETACYKVIHRSNSLIDISAKYYTSISQAYEMYGKYSNKPLFDSDACEPIEHYKSILNQIVVVCPDALNDYNYSYNVLNQIYVVTDCINANCNNKIKYYCKNLHTGFSDYFNRDEILGVIKPDCTPMWVKNNYQKYISKKNKCVER